MFFTAISVSFDMDMYKVIEVPNTHLLMINVTGQTELHLLSSLIITFTDGTATRKLSRYI